MPYVAGCEIRDNPDTPSAAAAVKKSARLGDSTPISYLTPDDRYVEKTCHARRHHRRPYRRLSTPSSRPRPATNCRANSRFTMACCPAQSRHLRHQRNCPTSPERFSRLSTSCRKATCRLRIPHSPPARCRHRLQRESRRLPPLAERSITPPQRSHWLRDFAHTTPPQWMKARHHRAGGLDQPQRPCDAPAYLYSTGDERIAFAAREDQENRQTLRRQPAPPISAMENVISNASAAPSATTKSSSSSRQRRLRSAPCDHGKLELEYEGEMKGADYVGRKLIRRRHRQDLRRYFTGANVASRSCNGSTSVVEIHFLSIPSPLSKLWKILKDQGLVRHLGPLGLSKKKSRATGIGRRIHPRRPARSQTHRPQRRTNIQGRREKADRNARKLSTKRTTRTGREDS